MLYSLTEFSREFGSPDACLARIFAEQAIGACPSCGSTAPFYRIASRPCYACPACKYQYYPLKYTIFAHSSTPLPLWFYAIYLFGNSKRGISAKELERILGVTYKCAWRMAKQIRTLFVEEDTPLDGIVEVDEAFIGGIWKHHAGRYPRRKVPLLGMVERQGRVKVMIIPDVKGVSLLPRMVEHIAQHATVITDDASGYRRLSKRHFDHHIINHSKRHYVDGMIYTNTVEGFWSILKRSIKSAHISVSPKYLQSYVDEVVWKYNRRFSSVSLAQLLVERSLQPCG